jgi:hypothetical protein
LKEAGIAPLGGIVTTACGSIHCQKVSLAFCLAIVADVYFIMHSNTGICMYIIIIIRSFCMVEFKHPVASVYHLFHMIWPKHVVNKEVK